MPRSVSEWVGKTDNHRAPGSVRQRVFDREGGRCHLCGQPIEGKRWDLDHTIALVNGGENRESNLRPAHQICHRAKTKADVAEKAKVAAIRARHTGARLPPARPIQSPGFAESKHAKRVKERQPRPALPVRSLYQSMEERS